MIEPEALLVLPRLRVQNANAISSPLTWGFPSPSAFTGFVHALHRDLEAELDLQLSGVGIVCHDFVPQASVPAGKRHRVFHLTRNPITKDEKPASIVEEGRAHMTVSLLVGVSGAGLYSGTSLDAMAGRIYEAALNRRLAGGSIIEALLPRSKRDRAALHLWPGTEEECRKLNRFLARRLLPGFALVSREGLLDSHWRRMLTTDPAATLLDALLDLSALCVEPSVVPGEHVPGDGDQRAEKVEWRVRQRAGWIVPIPAGYHAISELYEPGVVRNARDQSLPFRFVEGIYTVGQWLSPHRVADLRHLLWLQQAQATEGLYRWTTPHFANQTDMEGN